MKKLTTLCLLLFIHVTYVKADSWRFPEITHYYSESKQYFLEVHPANADNKRCFGTLFRIIEADTVQVWESKLVNAVAPVKVLVSNDGQHVSTFDDWYHAGYGKNVVVTYNDQGKLLFRYSLEELVDPTVKFRTTVSSRWWRGEPFLLDSRGKLILRIKPENKEEYTLAINLKSGKIEQ